MGMFGGGAKKFMWDKPDWGIEENPNPTGVTPGWVESGAEPSVEPAQRGLLGQGSAGQAALGSFLDAIAQEAGGQAQFAPVMQQKRERQNALADWQAKFEFEQANKTPPAPTEYERALAASGVVPGTPEWVKRMGMRAKNFDDPFTNIVSGGESLTGPRSLVEEALRGGGQASAQPGAASPAPARPAGMDDAALKNQALEAVRGGANIDAVMARLQAWGVKP